MSATEPKTWVLLLIAAAGSVGMLSGCDGAAGAKPDAVGPICATCGPSNGGETGDFGGVLFDCSSYLEEVELEEYEEARASRSVLEALVAEPLDAPFRWSVYDDQNPMSRPLEASGYEPDTRIRATITLTSPLRFSRRVECSDAGCSSCSSYISSTVRVELATLDGAVEAVTEGELWRMVADGPDVPASELRTALSTSVDLKDVVGTLRIETPPGEPHGRLEFYLASLKPEGSRGGLMMHIDVDDAGAASSGLPSLEGEYFLPLIGGI